MGAEPETGIRAPAIYLGECSEEKGQVGHQRDRAEEQKLTHSRL